MTDQIAQAARLQIPWAVPSIVPAARDHEYRRLVTDLLAAPNCLSSAACKPRALAEMGLVAPPAAVIEDKPAVADPTPAPPARRPDGSFAGLPMVGDEG